MKRLQILFFIFLCFAIPNAYTQNLNLEWIRTIGGTGQENVYGNAIDNNGNIYTTGEFNGSIDFNPNSGINVLTSNGRSDIYIQKLRSDGSFIWAKSIGGVESDAGQFITVDDDGNIYLTGTFSERVDFDPSSNIHFKTSVERWDVFVMKLDSNGILKWVKTFGGASTDQSRSIKLDAAGNVYTLGFFGDKVDFDPGIGTYNLVSATYDVFIQKLDNNGNFKWAKQFGGVGQDRGRAMDIDAKGNIYCAGTFSNTVDFDPGPGISNLTAQWNDVFIQKLDSNGTFLWAKKVGGLDSEIINSLKLDEFGNIYAIGTFGNTADFDPGSGIATITSQGNSDVFILKLDNQGNYKWAKAFGGTEFDFGYSLSIDKKGRVHSVGAFQGVVDFNPGPPSHLQTSNGQGDIYVQTLDSNGNFINVTTAGSSKYDYGRFTSISPSGDVYILGNFRDTVNVPYNGLGTSILSNGDLDVFIIKLSYCTPDTTFDSQTVCDKLTWIDGQTYYQSVDSLTHTLQNRYGCDSMVLLDLNVTNSDTSISLNGDTLTSNQISASYQWLNCIDSFNVIPLATNQSYTPTQNGDYAVEVSRNGCKDTSSCISITKLGITENSLKHSFRIYPNPTKGELTIEFDKRHSKIQAQLLSITRQVIDSKTVSNTNSLSFDLDAAKGIYLLELITENEGKAVVRIVKE